MQIKSIAIGKAKSYKKNEKTFESAYKKDEFFDKVNVLSLGLEGDIQVDKRFHGGFDKAIHIGSSKHLEKNPEFDKLFIGCNIIVDDLDEESVCVGDIYKIDNVRVQVTQPRQPCWKVSVLFGKEVNKYIFGNLATGWYVKVLEEGNISKDSKMVLEKRISNHTIMDLSKYLKKLPADMSIIEDIMGMDSVASSYKNDIQKKMK